MNRDELIAKAKEAGIWIPADADCETFITTIDELNKFAALITEPLKSKLAVIEDAIYEKGYEDGYLVCYEGIDND